MNKMDVKDYRKRYEAELAAGATAADQAIGSAGGLAAVANADPATKRREIQRAPFSGSTLGESVPALLATLRNQQEPVSVRDAALQALGAAAFLGEHFAPYRVEFLDTVRQLAQSDTASEL